MHAEIDLEDIPVTFQYLEIDVPEFVSTITIAPSMLTTNWRAHPEKTRRLGDHWLRAEESALLVVPSVIVPATWNVLINPLHPESKQVRVVRTHVHPADARLPR